MDHNLGARGMTATEGFTIWFAPRGIEGFPGILPTIKKQKKKNKRTTNHPTEADSGLWES